MIKIAITVRNRLAVTKKCIEAILQHSKIQHQIYIYDNLTNYKLERHFSFYHNLLSKGLIHQITFNTEKSTFGAFSKAVSSNQFGLNHEQDPKKKECEFLLILDNDAIVMPGWDETLVKAWRDVKRNKISNVFVIGQKFNGAVKYGKIIKEKIANCKAYHGKLGGSYFWSLPTNFFEKVGYLDISPLVGFGKKHDQNYWKMMEEKTNGTPYILALNTQMVLNAGELAGSVCNVLGYCLNDKRKLEKIKYKEKDEFIDKMSFTDFYNHLLNIHKKHPSF